LRRDESVRTPACGVSDSGEKRRRDGRDREYNRERDRERDRDRFGRDKERDNHSRSRRSTESPVSVAGSNNSRMNKRRYETINVPKLSLTKNFISSYDIKMRYGPNIHIPSDFNMVQLNPSFKLNFKGIPKPIKYRITDANEKQSNGKEKVIEEDNEKQSNGKEKAIEEDNEKEPDISDSQVKLEPLSNCTESTSVKTPKIGVKVVLLSLPTMADIYDRVVGTESDQNNTR